MTDLIVDPVPGHSLADMNLVADCHDVLKRNFPGYTWVIGLNDDESGGVMSIMNLDINEQILGCPNWGYILKLSTVYGDPELKCVMRAGGELLESAGISREINKGEQIQQIDGINHNRFPILRIL
jgi:hypothetical protein